MSLRTLRESYTQSNDDIISNVHSLNPILSSIGRIWHTLWLWTQWWAFIDNSNRNKVIKLGLDSDKSKSLSSEFEKHLEFYEVFTSLQSQWLVSSKLHIPQPFWFFAYKTDAFLSMERVRWISLKSLEIIDKYKKVSEFENINWLSDYSIETNVKILYWVEQSLLDFLAIDALDSVAKFYWNWVVLELAESIKILEDNWLKHTDFHSGNLMVDRNNEFWMIDFWSVWITWNRQNIKRRFEKLIP